MPELQDLAVRLVVDILEAEVLPTPSWLVRPGRAECGRRWPLVRRFYADLTGLELPDVMRPVERRTVDLAFRTADRKNPRIFEFDERQHFNEYRALTLRGYPRSIDVAFPKGLWIEQCMKKGKLEGGGFAVPRPPLFPGEGGRHRQRAFRDALCDLLPPLHEYLPTLRIGDFEVKPWIRRPGSKEGMEQLLKKRLGHG